jgi:hypothetical protein
MFEHLINLPLGVLIPLFVFGSMAMMISIDVANRIKTAYRFFYMVWSIAFFSLTLPLIVSLTGTGIASLVGGFLASLTTGYFLMKIMHITLIMSGEIEFKDVYGENENDSDEIDEIKP